MAYNDPAAGLTLFDTTTPAPTANTAAVAAPALQVAAVLPGGLLLSVPGSLFYVADGGADRLFRAPADLPDHHLTGLAALNGDIWAAGAHGVSRFDGLAWRTYTTTHGLAHTAVSALTLDPDGQPVVAFATADQGIARYDATVDSWQMVVCPVSGPSSAFVRAGLQMADGTVWFATNQGLARFDDPNWRIFTTRDGLPSNNVQAITLNRDVLWAGTDNGLAYWQDGMWRTVLLDDVRALSSGPDGLLWFFNADGLFTLAPDGRTLTPIPLPPVRQVYDQLATTDGFWLATDAGVLFWPVADATTGTDWQTFPTVDGQPMGEVTALAQAADGRVWAGADQGLWQLTAEGVWVLRPLPGLQRSPVTHLVADTDGSWLAGSYDGRVYRLTAGEIIPEKLMPLGNEHSPVSSILPVGEALWVAHFGGGVSYSKGSPGEREWQRFMTDDGLQEAAVNSVALGQDDVAWLGTDRGLLSISPQNEEVCRFMQSGDPPTWAGVLVDGQGDVWGVNGPTFWRLVEGEKVRSGTLAMPVTAVASDGSVWVATENGLVRHAGGQRQTVSLATISGSVTALAPGANGVIWVGTTEGIFWYDGRVWTHFTTADGLAANHVTHLVLATDGGVWVNTVGGVSRWSP